jgi:hypothetical protein
MIYAMIQIQPEHVWVISDDRTFLSESLDLIWVVQSGVASWSTEAPIQLIFL